MNQAETPTGEQAEAPRDDGQTGWTPEQKARMGKAKKSITYLLFFSIVMFFAGLTSAYLVSKGGANYWVSFHLPAAFWWSTLFILASSGTFHLALIRARQDRKRQVAPLVLLTLALGLAFSASQFKGWNVLLNDGYALVSRLKSLKGEYGKDYTIQRRGETLVKHGDQYYLPEDVDFEHSLNPEMDQVINSASSYFYALTYSHFLHIIGGLIALVVITIKSFMGRYGREDHQGLWAGAVYWHFLGGVWVYLLLFLAFIH